MSTINERIKELVDSFSNGNNSDFAKKLDISEANVRNYIRNTELKSNVLEKIARNFEINSDWLLTGEGSMFKTEQPQELPIQEQNIPKGELKPKTYSHTLQVRVVSSKAQAGWSDGYYNDEYLHDMPIITIDADQNHKGNYLAFEIQGDSMEPDYLEGDIVICREVQRSLWTSKLHFTQWDFVIAHNTQGIMLKAITDHDVQKGIITCHSLNPNHEDFTLRLADIRFLYNVVELRQHGKRKHLNRTRDFFI